MPDIEVIEIPQPIGYEEMVARQRARREAVSRGEAPNTLFLLEHTPTITRGRSTKPEHLLAPPGRLAELGVALVDADRGGDVTYHGPGQLVAYPILRLSEWKTSVGWYLRTLEQVLIEQLAGYGVAAWREEGYTGVWTAKGKVAAIGVGVHQWTTYHGIALNVSPDMAHFGLIVPCGIGNKPVTTLRELLGEAPPVAEVRGDFTRRFLRLFGHGTSG